MTIKQILKLKETEDKIEFKEAKTQYNYKNGRKSVLGYVRALANEKGGILALGIKETKPYTLVNSKAYQGRVGELEQNIYRDTGIRVTTSELFDDSSNRVVCIEIPPRPIGQLFYHDDVPLMRVGDRLERMSDAVYLSIIQEREPDFSAKVCPELKPSDLNASAISILKEKYAKKQNNPAFLKLPIPQILTDLNLVQDGGLTYAALILVGNEKALQKHLPNAQVNIEYRQTHGQTHFDKRETFLKPLFIAIDDIWKALNTRNRDNKISEGPYKFDLPYFNEEVIREAVLNAIAHRDYSINSETVIKQYPNSITILNAGGFPKGVTLENILAVNSTPRSRLLTEILEKTGLVERSGQGVDKIFRITLSEGKPEPDYTKTDFFQVELQIHGEVEDKAFAAFINSEQDKRDVNNKLGTFEIFGLYHIKEGKSDIVDDTVLEALEKDGSIKRVGGGASTKYVLADEYFALKNKVGEIGGFRTIDLERVLNVAHRNEKAKMGDFIENFKEDLNRDQVRYLIEKLIGSILIKKGSGSGTYYKLVDGVKGVDDIKALLADV